MNDITKLPKWAQEEFATLTRQRDSAVRTLNNFHNEQTPSRIWIEESPYLGEANREEKRRYLQAKELTFLLDEQEIHISFREDSNGNYLAISNWGETMCFKPEASNVIRIEENRR